MSIAPSDRTHARTQDPGDDVVRPIEFLNDLVAVTFPLWREAFLAEERL